LNEASYRAIVESADDPIFICDRDGRFLFGNPKAAANFGLTPETFAGRTVDELFAPDVAPFFGDAVRRVIDTGETSHTEDHIFIDGVEFWSSTVLQPLRDEGGRIYALQGIVRDITSRKQTEIALKASEERLRQVIRASNIGVFDINFVNRTIYFSPEQRVIWGIDAGEPLGWEQHRQYIHPDDVEKVNAANAAAHQRPDGVFEIEHRVVRRDGDVRHLIVRAQAIFDEKTPDRRLVRVIGATRDITAETLARQERDDLQARLLQAQKLESVGRLAGGIAHDFNNILNIIIGCSEMAASEPDPAAVSGYLDEILKAATRSADLTRQLLGFARRQTVMPRVVDLNDFVSASLKMLHRLIGEHVTLSWHPGVDVWPVRIDPGQVDQILVNLMANARDAIADVGAVVIHTENVPRSSSGLYPALAPGEYVHLAVVDNGIGMDDETQRHLFEPFYTTKPLGRGTGLGMASVDGIVRQNGGTITVESRVGSGTTVNVFLPRVRSEASLDHVGDQEPAKRGTETVLVVEDEPALLRLTKRSLETLGYTVLAASRPDEAIALATAHAGPVHMLVTDVVLPGMNGRSLAERLSANMPNLKCLFVSGYPDGAMGQSGELDEDLNFLQKPFTPKALADKVRQVLET
jgi:two-component system cell cycle sensor histidine kinase/response regulator CckA